MLSEGDRAPAFTLADQDSNKVKLTDLKGETVVVYFYPRRNARLHDPGLRHPRPRRRVPRAGRAGLGISPDGQGS